MIFLIEYNRSEGKIVTSRDFDDSQRREAEDSRLKIELDLNSKGIDHEVVLLEAASKDALRRTHRRYFEGLRQILKYPMGIFLNCTRNAVSALPPAFRKAEAMKDAKMLVVPKALRRGIFDHDISDKLVSEEMAERYLEITPPVFSLIPDYQLIINEIEQSYVIGNDFSSLSASCVVIERLLTQARIALHKYHNVINKLKGKGWDKSINALKEWGYLDKDFASELSAIYREVRCNYLHCGEIKCLRRDALRAITAAYKLMTMFIGFPEDLFSFTGAIPPTCKNEADPRFLEFYKPYYVQEGNLGTPCDLC